jgi:hypothetical protein
MLKKTLELKVSVLNFNILSHFHNNQTNQMQIIRLRH